MRSSLAIVVGLSWQQSYHVGVLEIAIIVVLIGALIALAAPWIMRRRGSGADWVSGNLLVTGVSPRPDATGEQFATITGVINGPTVDEHVVYQRLAIDVEHWPTIGQLYPVMYAPGNPDRWAFAPPQTAL
ncbi:MAG: hypothetical protein NVS4B6_27680 [Mycobacterium sp.]